MKDLTDAPNVRIRLLVAAFEGKCPQKRLSET